MMRMAELLTSDDFETLRRFAMMSFRKVENDREKREDLTQDFLVRVANWDCKAKTRDEALRLVRSQYRKMLHHTLTNHVRAEKREIRDVVEVSTCFTKEGDLEVEDVVASGPSLTDPEYGVVFMAIATWLEGLHPREKEVWTTLLMSGGDRTVAREKLGVTRQYITKVILRRHDEFVALCVS